MYGYHSAIYWTDLLQKHDLPMQLATTSHQLQVYSLKNSVWYVYVQCHVS